MRNQAIQGKKCTFHGSHAFLVDKHFTALKRLSDLSTIHERGTSGLFVEHVSGSGLTTSKARLPSCNNDSQKHDNIIMRYFKVLRLLLEQYNVDALIAEVGSKKRNFKKSPFNTVRRTNIVLALDYNMLWRLYGTYSEKVIRRKHRSYYSQHYATTMRRYTRGHITRTITPVTFSIRLAKQALEQRRKLRMADKHYQNKIPGNWNEY